MPATITAGSTVAVGDVPVMPPPRLPPPAWGSTLMEPVGPHWSESAPASMQAAIEAIVVAVADAFIGASIAKPKCVTLDVRANLNLRSLLSAHSRARQSRSRDVDRTGFEICASVSEILRKHSRRIPAADRTPLASSRCRLNLPEIAKEAKVLCCVCGSS